MNEYRTARTIRIILVIILLVLVITGLIMGARYIFSSNAANTKELDASQSALLSTSANRSVRMTVRGPIVADEDFRTYQIEITPNYRTFTGYSGYMDQQVDDISLNNNIPAYEQFVYALSHSNYMNGIELKGDAANTKGICATGRLYEFQILKDGKSVKKLWISSCSSGSGTFKGSLSAITNLFYKQIPGVQTNIGKLWR